MRVALSDSEEGKKDRGGRNHMIAKSNSNEVSAQMPVASYFGLRVHVLCSIKIYTLIRFQSREFVVETQDLVFAVRCARAA